MALDALADGGFGDTCLFCGIHTDSLYCSQSCRTADLEAAPQNDSPPPLVYSSLSTPESSPFFDPSRMSPAFPLYPLANAKVVPVDHIPQSISLPPPLIQSDFASASNNLFRFRKSPLLVSSKLRKTSSKGTSTDAPTLTSPSSAFSSPVFRAHDEPSTSKSSSRPPLSRLNSSSVPDLLAIHKPDVLSQAASASASANFLFSAIGTPPKSSRAVSAGHLQRRFTDGNAQQPSFVNDNEAHAMHRRAPKQRSTSFDSPQVPKRDSFTAPPSAFLPTSATQQIQHPASGSASKSSAEKLNQPHGFLFGRRPSLADHGDNEANFDTTPKIDDGDDEESGYNSSCSPPNSIRLSTPMSADACSPLSNALYREASHSVERSRKQTVGNGTLRELSPMSDRGRTLARQSPIKKDHSSVQGRPDITSDSNKETAPAERGRSRQRGLQSWEKRSRSRPRATNRRSVQGLSPMLQSKQATEDCVPLLQLA